MLSLKENATNYKYQMTFRYISAFCIIAIVVLGSYFFINAQFNKNDRLSEIINMSEKQRLLAQKTAFLMANIINSDDFEYKNSALKKLQSSVSKLEKNQEFLKKQSFEYQSISNNSEISKNAHAHQTNEVDEQISIYIRHVKNFINIQKVSPSNLDDYFLQNPEFAKALKYDPDKLTQSLDRAVFLYQNLAEKALEYYKKEIMLLALCVILVLLLEVLFIFRPMVINAALQLEMIEKNRNEAIDKAEEQETILNRMLENLPAIVFGKDVKNNYELSFLNKQAEEFFGLKKESALGKTDYDLWPKEEADWFHKTDLNVVENGIIVDVPCEQVTTSDGQARLVHTRKVPIFNKNGEPILLLGVAMDITERIQNERELNKYRSHLEDMVEKRTKMLREALEKAKELDHLKSDFLATMSHEIRTPMNGILGMAELIQGAKPSIQIEGYARTIINSGESLQKIIDDILDFSKIEAGKLEIDPMPVDLMTVVDDLAKLYAVKARDKALEIAVRYIPGSEQFVLADPVRIRQILSNLINNGIKFTDKGHVAITIEEEKNNTLSADKVQLKFSVIDTGVGLSKQSQAKIFEKFSQVDNSTTRKYGGTGLGLSICKSLVELMGGEIGVESEEGKGAKFWFKVVFERNTKKYYAQPKPQVLKDLRILVVDDLPVVRELVKEQLRNAGTRCEDASSGQKALMKMDRAFKENDPYEMVIVDYLMPEMNGEMLASAIYDREEFRSSCLIMLTAAGNPSSDEYFVRKGFSAYMEKPVSAKVLVESLAMIWKEYQSGSTNTLIRIDNMALRHADDEKEAEYKLSGSKILLAEDNLVNQIFIKEILEEMDVKCVIASNGKEAVDFVTKDQFDLIIMDCLMPLMDGFEATRKITAMKKSGLINSNLPILALTANAMKGDRETCLAAGMDDYLTKPVRKKELKDFVYYHFQKTLKKQGAKDNAPPSSLKEKTPKKEQGNYDLIDAKAVEQARQILKNKYDEMVNIYFENSWEYFEEIVLALNNNDVQSIVRPAHTLKSTSKQMGAFKLSKLASKIEIQAKDLSTDNDNSEINLSEITQDLEDLKQLIQETKKAFNQMTA